ncbi:GTP cyclohydrolase I [Leucobacter zeae]|nr:GTP cyclohydrolase I [Leucobacter zeae]
MTAADHRSDPAERAVADLLIALHEDPDDERLSGTPARVAAMLREALLRPPLPEVSFVERTESRSLITVADIPFRALCEHHLLPFRGVVHIGYLPEGRIVGASLPVRVVEHFSRGLQLQERMTDEIADWLDAHLGARGVGVVVEAEHLCMSFRGIGGPTTSLRTSAFRGDLETLERMKEDPCRREW